MVFSDSSLSKLRQGPIIERMEMNHSVRTHFKHCKAGAMLFFCERLCLWLYLKLSLRTFFLIKEGLGGIIKGLFQSSMQEVMKT